MRRIAFSLLALLLTVVSFAQNDSIVPSSMRVRIIQVLQTEMERTGNNRLVTQFMKANRIQDINDATSILDRLEEYPAYIDEFIYAQYLNYKNAQQWRDVFEPSSSNLFYNFINQHFSIFGEEYLSLVRNCREREISDENRKVADAVRDIREREESNEIFMPGDFNNRNYEASKPSIYLSYPTHSFETMPVNAKLINVHGNYTFKMILTKFGDLVPVESQEVDGINERQIQIQNALIEDNRMHPENYTPGIILGDEVDSYFWFKVEETFESVGRASLVLSKNSRTKMWECITSSSESQGYNSLDVSGLIPRIVSAINANSLLGKKHGKQTLKVKVYQQRIAVNDSFVVTKTYRCLLTDFDGSPIY